MPNSVQTYLHKLDDMMQRPDLQSPEDRTELLYRLASYWTGQLSRLRGGRPSNVGLTPSEISDLLAIIDDRIRAIRVEQKATQ